jgi:outer membrane immunogenic protein
MMRSIITIACGLTALASSAMAADLPVKAPPAPPAPVYTWTGCYLGGNVGWARAETRFRFAGVEDGASRSADGFAGGGQIGCDYQLGSSSSWLIGVQAMFDGADLDHSRVSVLFPANTFHNEIRWFGTITGRLGFLIGPSFLFYGKGGWGTVDQKLSVTSTATGALLASVDRRFSGPDAGVGFEWMFTPNWSLWVEWDHIFADHKTVTFFPVAGGAALFTPDIRRDFDKVLVGLNWRFGGISSPVRASY